MIQSIQNSGEWQKERRGGGWVKAVHRYGHAWLMLCRSHPILVAVGFITVVMAPIWHMGLHNTNLYGTLVRSYSLGCCSQSSVEVSSLILFILFKGGMLISGYHLGHCKAGILLLCCLLLGHLGLYTFVGHLGLYMFVAIWACT